MPVLWDAGGRGLSRQVSLFTDQVDGLQRATWIWGVSWGERLTAIATKWTHVRRKPPTSWRDVGQRTWW